MFSYGSGEINKQTDKLGVFHANQISMGEVGAVKPV